ncbi:putative ABC transporter [Peziza echinospora]|nr:putative ABC transporter [Peziza echinospora]
MASPRRASDADARADADTRTEQQSGPESESTSSTTATAVGRTPPPHPNEIPISVDGLNGAGYADKSDNMSTKDSVYEDIRGPGEEITTVTTHTSGGDGMHPLGLARSIARSRSPPTEMEALLSGFFNKDDADRKTPSSGVTFHNLTVKGVGIGASLAPTNGDVLLGPFRALRGLFRRQSRKPPTRTLIHNFTGRVGPGEMLLVLGRPGSGCSTFLKTIANQRAGFEEVSGQVIYGGGENGGGGIDAKTAKKTLRGEILYNPEEDLHYATLTVKETLKFAINARMPGREARTHPGQTRKGYIAEFLHAVSMIFNLNHALKTPIGDEYVHRGVSGGEKKRVSIAEAMVTKASCCQCWDNSTRGLDASTAVDYVQSLRTLTNMAGMATLVALYQAGEQLYQKFDKVLVIHEGRCAYFGPTGDAKPYLESIGFICPPRWTTSDFLTSVTNLNLNGEGDQVHQIIRPGWETRVPRTAEEFERCFRESEIYRENFKVVEEFGKGCTNGADNTHPAGSPRDKKATKNYTLSFGGQVWACTKRQFLVMRGDRMSLYGKWGGILFQALIVGSLFYDLPSTTVGVFPRGGVLFLALLFNALLALAELTSAFSSRPILLKHKSFSFYRPAAYAIAQTVVDIPLTFIQVLIFDVVVYFMANLQRTAGQFFTSLLILFVLTMAMYSFFRMIGSLSGSLDGATRVTGVAIQALIVYTGYLIPPTSMRPWLKWLKWINPVQYGFEALMGNEFDTLDIKCEPPFLVPPVGEQQYQGCLLQGSKPGQPSVSGADYIQAAYTYRRSHLWRNVGIIVAFWLLFVVLTAIGMEKQKANKGGAAVTIYKRGKTPQHIDDAINNGEAGKAKDEEVGEKVEEAVVGEKPEEDAVVMERVAKNDSIFTFQNVNYSIPIKGGNRRQLLKGVQGYVRPGRLVALMGGSGAGKTTLLNTLAQRINFGTVEGTFLVDGRPLPKSFQRATGFAEQQDVHEPTATVREALRFSALLRQPKDASIEEKYAYVETILQLLEMQDIAGAVVGTPGTGLNQEQRKLLTIGVELASKPELLMFLDEPTSGLDSGAALNIIRFLRKLADAGQAVLCTIHQPSAILFEHFDELMLLTSGGRMVYHGPLGKDSHDLIDYFERNGGHKCAKDQNPAEYMLDVIGVGEGKKSNKDWGDIWSNSEEYSERTREIEEIITQRQQTGRESRPNDELEFAMPWATQVRAVVKRSFISYWRSPNYIVGKFMLHIFTGLFNTFTFWKIGHKEIDMQSRLFSIFMTLTISPPLIQQLQPRFINLRDIFEARESAARIYHWTAFVIGAILPEIPYSLVAGTLYFNCWYWGVGFPRDSFSVAYTWGILMLFELFYVGFGQMIASAAPNELLASLMVPLLFMFVVSFCGVVVPYAALPHFWRSWMYYLTPFTYLLEGFLGVLTRGVKVRCGENEWARFSLPEGYGACQEYVGGFITQAGGYVEADPEMEGGCRFCRYSVGEEFAEGVNVFWRHRWRDFGIFSAYCVFNFAVVFLCSWLYLGGWRKLKARLSRRR